MRNEFKTILLNKNMLVINGTNINSGEKIIDVKLKSMLIKGNYNSFIKEIS